MNTASPNSIPVLSCEPRSEPQPAAHPHPPSPAVRWRWHAWADLNADTLHALLQLRQNIFIVEQKCPYADIDGLDPHCLHLCGHDAQGVLIAALRLLPPGLKTAQAALGRVAIAAHRRGEGLGRTLMEEGLRVCAEHFPQSAVFVSAQEHLRLFYASLGFAAVSAVYDEDGIAHVDMIRPARPANRMQSHP